MSNAATGSLTQSGQSSAERRVWLVAYLTIALGLIAALTAFWRSAYLIGVVLGVISLPTAAYAQMVSTHTNQRWLVIVGAIAGGFGAAMGAAHSGW
ncbi:MAG: hypothetical protein ABJC62_07850 [Frankiaceae bacterium]